MPDKFFLETYPLYRPFKIPVPRSMDAIPEPAINFECQICMSSQTFRMNNNYYDGFPFKNQLSEMETVKAEYTCVSCSTNKRQFFIFIPKGLDRYVKVGQNPSWEVSGNRDIEAMLGQHKDYLRKGLICESQGYGIAAFAYYRRIVEETIDTLLGRVSGLLSAQEAEQYAEALEQTKKTRVASEKIDLVKDLMPPILRPSGMNPLRALHEALSEGLHSQSEEYCLELSETIRDSLIFLATQINASTAATAAFTESMRKLLAKKAGRSADPAA